MLVAISALGSFLSLVAPTYIIGLLGIVPIVIGAKKLVQILKKESKVDLLKQAVEENNNKNKNKSYLPFLAVAAITFSNGGDNIGVYTPMFAQYNSSSQITTLIVVLMTMTAVWCIL